MQQSQCSCFSYAPSLCTAVLSRGPLFKRQGSQRRQLQPVLLAAARGGRTRKVVSTFNLIWGGWNDGEAPPLDGVEMVENGIVAGKGNGTRCEDAEDESDDSLDETGLSRHSSMLLKLHQAAMDAPMETDENGSRS